VPAGNGAESRPMRKKQMGRLARMLLFSLAAGIVAFLLIEGATSTVLSVYRIWTRSTPIMPERVHTRYDPELGWVSIPNLSIPNLYGPGVYLRTNSRGFRNNRDFDSGVAPGKVRIVCSGDSFALGVGVDNDHVWCEVLAGLDPRLETVNMGQGGYGVDQAYLWYLRDGVKIDHQIHLFTFITDDFIRMQFTEFSGYPKPRLKLRDGRLEVENVPVPRRAFLAPWLAQNGWLLRELRSLDLPLRALHHLLPSLDGRRYSWVEMDEVSRVALKVFNSLAELHKKSDTVLVLVYLPVREGSEDLELATWWRHLLQAETAKRNVPFLDLYDAFQNVPRDKRREMVKGHYTSEGHQYLARMLWSELRELPGLQRALEKAATKQTQP
jgi:hypothetical protein